jgi:hypothetical protein
MAAFSNFIVSSSSLSLFAIGFIVGIIVLLLIVGINGFRGHAMPALNYTHVGIAAGILIFYFLPGSAFKAFGMLMLLVFMISRIASHIVKLQLTTFSAERVSWAFLGIGAVAVIVLIALEPQANFAVLYNLAQQLTILAVGVWLALKVLEQ